MKTHDLANALTELVQFLKAGPNVELKNATFPVEVRSSDSVRDVVGRLLRYLEEHPEASRRLQKESAKKSAKASPELMKAFSILLGEEDSNGADGERE